MDCSYADVILVGVCWCRLDLLAVEPRDDFGGISRLLVQRFVRVNNLDEGKRDIGTELNN